MRNVRAGQAGSSRSAVWVSFDFQLHWEPDAAGVRRAKIEVVLYMKVVPFVPKSVAESSDYRFHIIDENTGEVLDDAQGYGYKTVPKAYAAWMSKNGKMPAEDERRRKTAIIKRWLREHESFVDEMEDVYFRIAKGSCGFDAVFDAECVRETLDADGFTDLPFTPVELLIVWMTGSFLLKSSRRESRK